MRRRMVVLTRSSKQPKHNHKPSSKPLQNHHTHESSADTTALIETTLKQLFHKTDPTQTLRPLTTTKAGWCLREGLAHILSVPYDQNNSNNKNNNNNNNNNIHRDKMINLVRAHPLPSMYSTLTCCRPQHPNKITPNGKDKHGNDEEDTFVPRNDCFRSLCQTISGQQLAGSAARTVWNRLLQTTQSNPTPETILSLCGNSNGNGFECDENLLRTALQIPSGLSFTKARAVYDVALSFHSGHLTDEFLTSSPESIVRDRLLSIRGIGPWTCDMFLMFCLEQSDVWPMGDLGVRKGTKEFFGLKGSGKNGVLCGKKDRELMETVVEP